MFVKISGQILCHPQHQRRRLPPFVVVHPFKKSFLQQIGNRKKRLFQRKRPGCRRKAVGAAVGRVLPPLDKPILLKLRHPAGCRPLVDGKALGKLFLVGEKNLYPDDMKVKRALDTAAVFYPDFDRSYAESLAKQFELPLNKKINGLSTGYGSIFRLILGLSVNTPYVLFDEPVLGLDAQHRDLFYKLLVQKYAEHPCTMVVSTHLIAEVADLIEHTVIIRKGRILQDAPTEELTAACWAVSGPAGVVDSWAAGRDVFTSSVLGGLKTVCIRGGGTEDLPAGLERRRVGLQEYFISLMEEEDQR